MDEEKIRKKVLFVSGTRADFGKIKPLIQQVKDSDNFEYQIFVTGMHMLSVYGMTVYEIYKAGFDNVYSFINQDSAITSQMDIVLATTVQGLAYYVREYKPDLLVVHGDRVESLAGASSVRLMTRSWQNRLIRFPVLSILPGLSSIPPTLADLCWN